jgi:hypothetical protein
MGPSMGYEPPSPSTTGEIDASLVALVEPDEEIVDHVAGLGAHVVVTSRRVVVVRQGAHFRPRNGIRSWPHGDIGDIFLTLPRHGNGRLFLQERTDRSRTVSVFIDASEWSNAERVVGVIHARARTQGGHEAS